MSNPIRGDDAENLALVIARLEQIAGNFTEDPREAAEQALVCARALIAPVSADVAADIPTWQERYKAERTYWGMHDEKPYMAAEIADLRARLAAGAPAETVMPDPEAELLDMLGRIHPFAMSKAEDTGSRKERITRPYVRQQPWPVPDQACIVWRADLMHVCGDLTRYKAYFDSHVPAATPSQSAEVARDAALRFADEILSAVLTEGADFDGGNLQQMAVEHGLLRVEDMAGPCGENCACANYGVPFWPSQCYRKTYVAAMKLQAPAKENPL